MTWRPLVFFFLVTLVVGFFGWSLTPLIANYVVLPYLAPSLSFVVLWYVILVLRLLIDVALGACLAYAAGALVPDVWRYGTRIGGAFIVGEVLALPSGVSLVTQGRFVFVSPTHFWMQVATNGVTFLSPLVFMDLTLILASLLAVCWYSHYCLHSHHVRTQ